MSQNNTLLKEKDISSPNWMIEVVQVLFYLFGMLFLAVSFGGFIHLMGEEGNWMSWLAIIGGLVFAAQYYAFAELLDMLIKTQVNTLKLLHRIDKRPHDLEESENQPKAGLDEKKVWIMPE